MPVKTSKIRILHVLSPIPLVEADAQTEGGWLVARTWVRLAALSVPVLLTASCLGQTLLPKHIETPIYPPLARIARIQGTVTLKVTIDADGNVERAEVANDAARPIASVLQESAIDNMQHWTFEKPPSAPFTQVVAYRYAFDGSLPANDGRNPITKVNIDLPDRVTILANDAVAHIYFTDFGVRSVKCLYLWHCGSRWGGEDFYFYRVRSARCLYLWRCGLHRRLRSDEQSAHSRTDHPVLTPPDRSASFWDRRP